MYDYVKGSCKKGRAGLFSVAFSNRSESVGWVGVDTVLSSLRGSSHLQCTL